MQGCRLTQIFQMQQGLLDKFYPIEKINLGSDFVPDVPVNLNDKFGQYRIRHVAWRLTEEFTELFQTTVIYRSSEEFEAELSDCLHFLVELMITVGVTPEMIFSVQDESSEQDRLTGLFNVTSKAEDLEHTFDNPSLEQMSYWVIAKVGFTISHHLKMKPWKQNGKPVLEEMEFRCSMALAFWLFIKMVFRLGYTADDLFNIYQRKNLTNQNRLKSGE